QVAQRDGGDHGPGGREEGAAGVEAASPGLVADAIDVVAVHLHHVVEGRAVLGEDASDVLDDRGRLAGEVSRMADLAGGRARDLSADEDHVAAAERLAKGGGELPVPGGRRAGTGQG